MNRMIVLLCMLSLSFIELAGQHAQMPTPMIIETRAGFAAKMERHAPPLLEREVPEEVYPGLDTYPVPLNLQDVKTAISYPQEAIAAGFEGQFTASILVDEQGHYVRHVWLGCPNRYLSRHLDPYIGSILFAPATYEGKAVAGWVAIPFSFRLRVPRG